MALSGMSTNAVPPAASSAQTGTPNAELASLRAAPARGNGSPAPNGAPKDPSQAAAPSPKAASQPPARAPTADVTAATPATPAAAAVVAAAGPTFGQTLAAQQPAATSGRNTSKPKTTRADPKPDPKPAPKPDPKADAQAPGGGAAATQLLTANATTPLQPPAAGPPDPDTDAQGTDAASAAIAPATIAAARAGSALTAAVQLATPRAGKPPTASSASDPEDDTDTANGTGTATTGAAIGVFPLSAHAALPQTPSAALGNPGEADDTQPADLAAASAALGATSTSADAPTQAAATVPAQNGPAVTAQLHAAVGTSAWANELGARLHWMAGQGVSSASLRLTPQQLGPVEVKISMDKNAASVWFSAAQPETRTALEAALPRLRELFCAQGLNLAQAGVSDQSAHGAERQPQQPTVAASGGAARDSIVMSVTSLPRVHQGLLDLYA